MVKKTDGGASLAPMKRRKLCCKFPMEFCALNQRRFPPRASCWSANLGEFDHVMSKLASAAAPVLFVLLWSTGFIGAKYGLPYVEPLTFLGVRMIFVVIILAGMALLVGARWPRCTAIGHSMVAGSLVHGTYLGGVFIAISHGVPAGISALIPGLQPVLTSTIADRFMGEKVTPLQWLPPPPPPPRPPPRPSTPTHSRT